MGEGTLFHTALVLNHPRLCGRHFKSHSTSMIKEESSVDVLPFCYAN
jgi:hypothetical protein